MVLRAESRTLYVSVLGNYGAQDGGVEAIDVDALASSGWVSTEAQLGGDVGPIAVRDSRVYAVVSGDFFFTNRLVAVSAGTGAPLDTILTTSGFVSDMELDDSSAQIFLCDRDAASPGVRVVNAVNDTETTAAPLSTGLAPFDLAVVRTVDTGVEEPEEAGSFPAGHAAWAQPNPFRSRTEIYFRSAADGERRVEIYDAAGRLVRELRGSGTVVWDGRARGGGHAGPGVYFFRVVPRGGGGAAGGGRIVLIR
jgi:hypothetical protein